MKRIVIIFMLSLFLSACIKSSPSTKTGAPIDKCFNQKAILEGFLQSTDSIGKSAFLDEDMVRGLIRPLYDGFDIDSEECSGYTIEMRAEALSALHLRSDEIESYLVRICSSSPVNENYNASDKAYHREQFMAAVAALEYIGASTDACYKDGR